VLCECRGYPQRWALHSTWCGTIYISTILRVTLSVSVTTSSGLLVSSSSKGAMVERKIRRANVDRNSRVQRLREGLSGEKVKKRS
jgi:hypothetical protein